MIRVILPLPPRMLRPNARPSCWQARARAVKQYRRDAYYAARKANGHARPLLEQATVHAFYYHRDKRGILDPDNALATLKAAIDGLVDAGLLAGDREVTYLPVVQLVDRKEPRVELEVIGA